MYHQAHCETQRITEYSLNSYPPCMTARDTLNTSQSPSLRDQLGIGDEHTELGQSVSMLRSRLSYTKPCHSQTKNIHEAAAFSIRTTPSRTNSAQTATQHHTDLGQPEPLDGWNSRLQRRHTGSRRRHLVYGYTRDTFGKENAKLLLRQLP